MGSLSRKIGPRPGQGWPRELGGPILLFITKAYSLLLVLFYPTLNGITFA